MCGLCSFSCCVNGPFPDIHLYMQMWLSVLNIAVNVVYVNGVVDHKDWQCKRGQCLHQMFWFSRTPLHTHPGYIGVSTGRWFAKRSTRSTATWDAGLLNSPPNNSRSLRLSTLSFSDTQRWEKKGWGWVNVNSWAKTVHFKTISWMSNEQTGKHHCFRS